MLIQYWHETKVARENPIMNLTIIYPAGSDTNDMQKTVGVDNLITNAQPYRGPSRSQTAPIASLENILPETEATPAFPISIFLRFRLSRIIGTSGAAAKVDTKQVGRILLSYQSGLSGKPRRRREQVLGRRLHAWSFQGTLQYSADLHKCSPLADQSLVTLMMILEDCISHEVVVVPLVKDVH
ncbi:unnamed protein product [Fraxinus pennsylvanica]|uniref:Uncharacterized protein n=1 Tax=Fraxinus pennsylvanica TaxID=56036 RepID=A0AAD1ZEZ2_9LAMI|nr:unnamed protein product [Fraxinus pennsylvanica]